MRLSRQAVLFLWGVFFVLVVIGGLIGLLIGRLS